MGRAANYRMRPKERHQFSAFVRFGTFALLNWFIHQITVCADNEDSAGELSSAIVGESE
jgi:hypothetical protein